MGVLFGHFIFWEKIFNKRLLERGGDYEFWEFFNIGLWIEAFSTGSAMPLSHKVN
jgi:hypothetical protein